MLLFYIKKEVLRKKLINKKLLIIKIINNLDNFTLIKLALLI